MQEKKGTTEDEMVGWHHRLNGHERGQTLGSGEGQGGLVCCSPCGLKESDMTGQLNNNNNLSVSLLEEEAFLQRHQSETITVYNAKHFRVYI